MKLRPFLAACGLSLSLAVVPAQALIPTTDIANLVESIIANMQEMMSWAEEQTLMKKAMEQSGMNTSAEVDTINNAVSNMIVRMGRTAEEIQNLEVMRDAMPARDACSGYSASLNLEDVVCAVEDATSQSTKKAAQRINTLGKSAGETAKHIEDEVTELVNECRALGTGGDLAGTACLQTEQLLGGAGSALDAKGARATEAMVTLMVAPVPEALVDDRLGEDPMSEAQRATALRKLALQQLATDSLMQVRAARLSVDGKPSQLQLLRKFAEEHFGTNAGADYLAIMTNTHKAKTSRVDKQSTTSQVMRSMATMDAFLVYMEVLKYEQQLRMESLQAGLLAATIDPVKK